MIDEARRAAIMISARADSQNGVVGSRGSAIPKVRARAESPIVVERPRGLTQSLDRRPGREHASNAREDTMTPGQYVPIQLAGHFS